MRRHEALDLSHAAGKALVNVYLSRSDPIRPTVRSSPARTDNNASRKARREYEKGVHELQARNLNEAAAHLEKAVKEYPCYARAQTDLATVLSQQHQFDRSESALKKAIYCDPDFLNAYSELGQLYYNEKRFQESESVLQEGLRRSPGGWQFYYQMAADDYRLGQFSKAEQEYLKAESFSSQVPAEIHVKLADVYLKERAFEKTYSEMQGYLRIEPNGRFASKIKTTMQRMKADGISGASQLRNSQNPLPGFTTH
jgi:tetratricopeptide (TPR) repeat protein